MKKETGGIKNRLKEISEGAAAVILLVVMILSAALLAEKCCSDRRGKAEYQLIKKIAGMEENKDRDCQQEECFMPLPDNRRLLEINSDYAGWICIPGTSVSYPVVYPKDNQEYLKQTFEGQKNLCGCLFFEASRPPFSSENTVIYGHNMKSGEMFGSLKKYREEEFFRQNRKIYFCYGEQWAEYQIQKVYLTDSGDKSPYEPGGTDSGKICLTLSTCYGKEHRLIIQAKKFISTETVPRI